MGEEFLNINPPGGFPPPRPDDDPLAERRTGAGWLKSIFVFLLLVLIVVASFFVSFQLGSRILSPVQKSPGPKINVAIPEPPASIASLQKLQAAMSREAVKSKPVAAKVPPRSPARTKRARLTGKHYYKVQVGLFEDKAAAEELGAKVQAAGFDLYVKKVGGGWRAQVGAYRTKEGAEELRGQLTAKGFSSQLIYE
jgi:cell division protein FtsN